MRSPGFVDYMPRFLGVTLAGRAGGAGGYASGAFEGHAFCEVVAVEE